MTSRPMYRGGPSGQDEPEPSGTEAALDLAAADLISDPELLGPAMILLGSRPCGASCPVGRRQDRMRDRDFGPAG